MNFGVNGSYPGRASETAGVLFAVNVMAEACCTGALGVAVLPSNRQARKAVTGGKHLVRQIARIPKVL